MSPFNSMRRIEILKNASHEPYDLLIVGGGITGAGVARDAASRGLRVLLVEADDFASGTSSRSSKLVHGGIRYLENLEFGLVHEALSERRLLLEIAPHMVHPLRFMIPVYKNSRVGLLKMELGMILYDLLSVFEAPKLHQFHGKRVTAQKEPLLLADNLSGSVIYSDAYMEDDRLVLETLRSANELGAECVNFVKATRIEETEDGCRIELQDTLTQETYSVRAQHVAGCVGPWTDIFGKETLPQWENVLRPTKGVHVVFDRARIPVQQAVVMAVEQRIVFVIPRDQVVIVGTTDTDFRVDPREVTTDSEDVHYLLSVANQYFPGLNLEKSDIISCYAGVRPLVKDQSSSESKTSREHEIFEPSRRITVVAGGKYTTYRSMAEEIVDRVLKRFSFEERMALSAPRTKVPLNPSVTADKIDRLVGQAEDLAQQFEVSKDVVAGLARRHGEEALEVLQKMLTWRDRSIEERLWCAEATFAIQNEMCLRLVDFLWRRSPLFLFTADHGARFLRALGEVFVAELQWTPSRLTQELELVDRAIARDTASLR